jgi:hypothetical protein
MHIGGAAMQIVHYHPKNYKISNPKQGDSDMTTAEQVAVNEAKAVEVKAEAVKQVEYEKTQTEVAKAAEAIKAETTKDVPVPAKRTKQPLTAEEKLVLREIENEYLKAQIQITTLSNTTQNAQKKFTTTVEGFGKKYDIIPAEMQFDNVALEFVAVPKKQ